jgi:protein Tex
MKLAAMRAFSFPLNFFRAPMPQPLLKRLARDAAITEKQAAAAVELMDGGATVPFIARYRKEVTDNLDDIQLRFLEERLGYLRELDERRETVITAINEQGKMTPELAASIDAADNKQTLEDLYAPYKQKRRTKAQIAREAGLGALVEKILTARDVDPAQSAAQFVNAEAGFADVKACLDGARDILTEQWAEDAKLVGNLREWLWENGLFESAVVEGKEQAGEKFRDYFTYSEAIAKVPSHRALAVFRGWLTEMLTVKLAQPEPTESLPAGTPTACERTIARHIGFVHQGHATDDFMQKCVAWTWRVKLSSSLERDVFARLREAAEATAINVFGDNVRDVLLAAPAGAKTIMGLDPGIRTGVKVAVVDSTGKVVDTATVYPHEPRKDWDGSLHTLSKLVEKHHVQMIAIGNGTASRETDTLAADLIKQSGAGIVKVVVSEAGASVYSASEYASQELPDLDVSLRGAVSIARRLQDPLAELVKIDPKSIGVGQYQHDVSQSQLARKLDAVVETCVNAVGVDVNLASAPLLARVAGLSGTNARAIVEHRERHGAFASRQALLKVSSIGPKTFEQAAGFLRIQGGTNPLDASAVHPESYPLVEAILERIKKPISEIVGNKSALASVKPESFASAGFGEFTVRDVLAELEKPGRDPRPEFKAARFNDGVNSIKDLTPGMLLEGTVTNVAAFGAFVDIGAHQDGLVHVSQLANKFVKDPKDVVKAGDVVKVKVVEVDVERKRIALTMRLDAEIPAAQNDPKNSKVSQKNNSNNKPRPQQVATVSAMASAFAKLKN